MTMGSPVTMDGRNYLNLSNLRASSKPSPKNHHHKALKKTNRLHQRHQLTNLPTHPRHNKMSGTSQKRARPEEPFNDPLYDQTGLDLGDGPPAKRIHTTTTSSELEIYNRRRRVASYAEAIRRKRSLANKVASSWSNMPTASQRGMPNLTGSLCYRLSLLQSLLHQPQFVNWIQTYHRADLCVSDSQETCVACSIRRLTLEYWRGSAHASVELSKVLRAMAALFKTIGWKSDVSSGHADPDEQAAWIFGEMRKEMPSSVYEYLESFFQLVTTSSIRCSKCGHESKTTGHDDQSLSIPISPRTADSTLPVYLQRYMVEEIEGYRCAGCKDDNVKERVQLVGHAPNILAIQLKRFDYDGSKINTPVRIPTNLDLDRYRDSDNNSATLRYELSAVIKHAGDTSFGHYICGAKASDGEWYRFDDETKSKSSVVEATCSSKSGFTPYLLFFQRKWE